MADKASAERTRLMVLLAMLSVVAVWAGYRYFSEGGLGGELTTRVAVEFSTHEIPELHPYSLNTGEEAEGDSHRNPFIFGKPPTPTRNLTPQPTRPPPATRAPTTPRPKPTVCAGCPGPPPQFRHTYLGNFGPERLPVAVFRKEEDIEVGYPGSVIDEKFIVREVGLESVVIGFVGFPEEVSTRVPLAED